MSRHKNRHHRQEPEQQKPERTTASPLVCSFGDRVGVEMKSTRDLMNWLIFGDTKQEYYQPNARNHEGF